MLKVALSGTIQGGELWLTRFFIQYTGTAPAVTDLNTFNNAVEAAYSADLKALANTDVVLTQIETIDLSSSSGAVSINPFSLAGTAGGAALPAQCAAVVSYKIARRYRGGHPRGYWPYGTQGNLLDPGHWNSTFTAASDTDIGAFFTAVLAAGWAGAGTLTHVNVSYFTGFTVVVNPTTGRARNVPTLRPTPLIDTITTLKTQPSVGTQRRREAFVD